MVLLGLTVYLIYSSYTLYQTDTASKPAIKQALIIQGVQMLLIIGLAYSAFTTTAAPKPVARVGY